MSTQSTQGWGYNAPEWLKEMLDPITGAFGTWADYDLAKQQIKIAKEVAKANADQGTAYLPRRDIYPSPPRPGGLQHDTVLMVMLSVGVAAVAYFLLSD